MARRAITKSIVKVLTLLLVILACSSRLMQTQQQQQSTTIKLNTPTQFTQSASTPRYYQSVVTNPSAEQVLLITISADIRTSLQIYVSTSESPNFVSGKWPSWNSYSQQCFYSSLNTCALKMPDASDLPSGQNSLTVYFTVQVGADCTYTLDVSLQTIYPVHVDVKYSVTFKNSEAAMLQLSSSQFTTTSGAQAEQIVISSFYSSYRDIGQFQLLAAVDEFPEPSKFNIIRSKSLNALTQILVLPPLKSSNSSYFILIEGQNGTKFNITIKSIMSISNPTLSLNDSISYLTNKQINYTYNGAFPQNTLLPFTLDLYAYRGYGKFTVDYCQGLYNFTFSNSGGENGQIYVSPENRQECKNKVTKVGGLLLQNLIVSVSDIGYEFGYSIGLYEGVYEGFLMPGMKQIGVLDSSDDSQTYNVAAYGQTVNFTLTAYVFIGSVNISVHSCKTLNSSKKYDCVQLNSTTVTSPADAIDQIQFSCPDKTLCRIIVSQLNNTQFSKYSLMLEYSNTQSTQLLPNKPQFDLIQMNQYLFYFINVTALRADPQNKFSNATQISVRNTIVNGDIVMLSSTTVQKPKFQGLFEQTPQVQYHWSGIANFIANNTYPEYIYIGILGDSQAIYHLQFVLNTSANIPAAYLDMVDDAQNDYTISSDSPFVLAKFTSHIIPYSITFDPAPSCIQYGSKLPISSQCISPNQMPNVFHEQVIYFNLSQSLPTPGAVFKFSAYVNSGAYLLSQDRPVLISCQTACYQFITVVLQNENATILHTGDGSIGLISNKSNTTIKTVSNGPLELTCNLEQCTYSLNASLKYGGSMQVAYQSSSSSQIQWRTKPMTVPDQNEFQYYYMRLPKYTDFYSFIFYAQAADLTVYYNVVSLDESYTNIVNYVYPSPTTYMGVSYGDPLQEIHVVDVDEQLLEMNKCKSRNIICIITMAVTLNSSIEYSSDFIRNGLGYYSANTYQYDISPSWPILKLKQEYSLSYFSHTLDFTKENTNLPYTIHIQPMSNCRPQIQTQSTYYLRNYYTDVRLPRVMPGQSRINYRVLSNQVCLYSTALTNLPYELIFTNVMYNIQANISNGSVVLVYQHSSYSESFTIRLSQNVSEIVLGLASYATDADGKTTVKLPTKQAANNIAYVQNTSALTLNTPDYGQYIIVINLLNTSTSKPKYSPLSVIVQQANDAITVLHNQEHVYVYDPSDNSIAASSSDTVVYDYHTTNNFYIFVSTNRLQVRITVRDEDIFGPAGQIINTVITNQSQPWLTVNSKTVGVTEILTNYRIKCEFVSPPPAGTTATLKLHIEEQGVAGLVQLYEGVSTYDAFIHESAMNCYKYKAPMIMGENKMVVDINFVSGVRTQDDNDVRGMATLVGTAPRLLSIKQNKISGSTLRMEMDYYAGTMYKICYTLNSHRLVGHEYNVVINVPSMPMIYNNEYDHHSAIYRQPYTMFEYINHWYNAYDDNHSVPVSFTVTNCMGSSSILSSSSYLDMLTGKMTQVSQELSSNGVTAALVNVPHGYYYFAVKADNSQNGGSMFRTSVQYSPVLDGKSEILQSMFSINWKVKAKIFAVQDGDEQYVSIQVPTVIKTGSANNYKDLNVSKIVYSMYLLNLYNSNGIPVEYPYTIDAYTRCPSLFSIKTFPNITFTPKKVHTLENPYNASSVNASQYIQFNIPIQDFYPMSNITVKADVYVSDSAHRMHIVQYYYPESEIQILPNQGSIWTPIKWIFILCMLFVCLGGLAFAIKFYLKKRGRNVNFQMAEFPVGQEMQSKTTPVQELPVETTNVSGKTSNRRPLNSSAGYGQFVDQV